MDETSAHTRLHRCFSDAVGHGAVRLVHAGPGRPPGPGRCGAAGGRCDNADHAGRHGASAGPGQGAGRRGARARRDAGRGQPAGAASAPGPARGRWLLWAGWPARGRRPGPAAAGLLPGHRDTGRRLPVHHVRLDTAAQRGAHGGPVRERRAAGRPARAAVPGRAPGRPGAGRHAARAAPAARPGRARRLPAGRQFAVGDRLGADRHAAGGRPGRARHGRLGRAGRARARYRACRNTVRRAAATGRRDGQSHRAAAFQPALRAGRTG